MNIYKGAPGREARRRSPTTPAGGGASKTLAARGGINDRGLLQGRALKAAAQTSSSCLMLKKPARLTVTSFAERRCFSRMLKTF
ncbi:hypothetical protein O9993_10520 [Vibrio lentus]|nr:hypothetical protein [Vibrio lentus]